MTHAFGAFTPGGMLHQDRTAQIRVIRTDPRNPCTEPTPENGLTPRFANDPLGVGTSRMSSDRMSLNPGTIVRYTDHTERLGAGATQLRVIRPYPRDPRTGLAP